jgi:hypothetical protein
MPFEDLSIFVREAENSVKPARRTDLTVSQAQG